VCSRAVFEGGHLSRSSAVTKDLEFPNLDLLRGTSWQNVTDRASLPSNAVRQLLHAGLTPLVFEYLAFLINIGWRFGIVVTSLDTSTKVTLRHSRLVLGWVTVYRRVNHLGM